MVTSMPMRSLSTQTGWWLQGRERRGRKRCSWARLAMPLSSLFRNLPVSAWGSSPGPRQDLFVKTCYYYTVAALWVVWHARYGP